MPDMLVKLYELPDLAPLVESQKVAGVEVRRAIPPEKHVAVNWVRKTFDQAWASECEVAFSHHPVSCFIAIRDEAVIGFACYDATCKDFFGPEGVGEPERGKGIGKALLISCLQAMADQGYAYAIIGGAGPVEFYSKSVGAIAIEDSSPGIYRGMLREEK